MMQSDYEWINEYSIGIEEIDAQHKRILELIRKTHLLAGQSTENAQQLGLLNELIRYMHFHFSSEEHLMREYNYPKIMEQNTQHDQLLKDLNIKYKEIESGRGNLVQFLFIMMKWFIGHDNQYDKEFGRFVAGIRESQENNPKQ
jgi:hemerythrin